MNDHVSDEATIRSLARTLGRYERDLTAAEKHLEAMAASIHELNFGDESSFTRAMRAREDYLRWRRETT